MNGVSHMLPFVVGGGVLIALGFLIDTIAGNADVGGTFGFTSPIASAVFWIGKAAFALMLPILAGLISLVLKVNFSLHLKYNSPFIFSQYTSYIFVISLVLALIICDSGHFCTAL